MRELFVVLLLVIPGFGVADERPEAVRRVVSLAPSLTEIVFSLGGESLLVGVSSYCDYPEEARALPRIGGLYDPNYEAILELKPDVVLTLKEHAIIREQLLKLEIETVTVANRSLDQIVDSIRVIGARLGKEREASQLISLMKSKIAAVHDRASKRRRPTVLVAVGGHTGSDDLERVYIAGRSTIFDELVSIAGGKNALAGRSGYTQFSAEGFLALNPDVVIDLVPPTESGRATKGDLLRAWRKFPEMQAVRNKRVHVFTDEFAVNPGPRIVDTLALFEDAIHRKGVSGKESAS